MAWYDNIPGLSQMALPVTIERGKPAPLDKYALWDNYDLAIEFAQNHPSAYVGQFLYVKAASSDGKNSLGSYVITGTGEGATLLKLAETTSSGDVGADVAALQSQMATLLSDENQSGSIDNRIKLALEAHLAEVNPKFEALDASVAANASGIAANLEAIGKHDSSISAIEGFIANLDASVKSHDASIAELVQAVADVAVYDLKAVESPEEAWAAQYEFTKDGQVVTTINIPKDQFLKEASFVASASAEDKAIDANVVEGDPYLKFVWQIEQEGVSVSYVPVKELVDTYEGSQYIDVANAEGKNQIVLKYNDLLAQLKADLGSESVDSSIASIESSIQGLDSSVSGLESTVANLDSSIQGIAGSVANLDSSVSANESAIQGLDSSVSGLESTVANLDASVGANASEIESIKASLETIDSSIGKNASDIADVSALVASNKQAADASIESLSSDLSTLQGEFGTLSTTVEDISTRLSNFSVDAVETIANSNAGIEVDSTDARNVKVGLKISVEEGNLLQMREDGAYVAMEWGTIE